MSFLAELQSLACLVSQRPEVTVHLGDDPERTWCFNWPEAKILVNPADYVLRSRDFCRGLLLHESAHAAITRYHEIMPANLVNDPVAMHLMNVVEDCRIESWLQRRLPGCAPWIKEYNDFHFGKILKDAGGMARQHAAPAFLLGILSRWWFGRLPEGLHPRGLAALNEVWPHVERAVSVFPPAAAPDLEATRAVYQSHEVSVCYRTLDPVSEPDSLEMPARMTQHEMWTLVREQILPAFRRLLHQSGEEEAFTRWAASVQWSLASTSEAAENAEPRGPAGIARHRGRRRHANGALYARVVARHQREIEQLTEALLRYLTAETKLKAVRGQPSGPRLDVRAAMQFEADPRRYNRLWLRAQLPQRPDPHFIVLVDVSGSMRGPNADATFAGLVLLREVCLRSGIALSIVTFGARADLVQSWEDPNRTGTVQALEVVADPNDESTHLLDALDETSLLLETNPFREVFVWVLSDGEPANVASCAARLRQLRQRVTALIGLGLGPKTLQMEQLIPGARGGLQPRQLPALMGRLLGRLLRRGG